MDSQFDVFISYNTKDRPVVVQIAEKLQGRGLVVWLDDWQIQPGRSVPRSIDEGVRNSRSVAVFIGPNDVGPFQDDEIEAIIMEQIDRGIPAISVLLPGASEDAIAKLPRLLTRNRWIEFRNGVEDEETLYLLHWGITGMRPKPPESRLPEAAPPPEPRRDPVEDVLNKLAKKLETENVTYFLGPGAAFGCAPMPAQGCDIARELLAELQIISTSYKDLLPPVGVAGMYYSAKSGDRDLEKKVMERMAESSKTFPAAHDQLASLLKKLPSRPAPRGGYRVPQLIVTTNFDLMMERALLRAGLSFTRVVQYRSGEQIDVDQYHVQLNKGGTVQVPPAAGGPLLRARIDDCDELDVIIKTRRKEDADLTKGLLDSVPWQELPEPILYKFLGSQEVTNSCVLSTPHHFTFPRRLLQGKFIPEYISHIITNSTTLFLGPWFTDLDFQLTYYTLLCDPFRQSNDIRYALQLPPQQFAADVYRQQMDSRLWEEIKDNVMAEMKIKTLEVDAAHFLRGLCAKF